ncbi:hypothetical protein J4E86_001364 [Alternaria arbusti]|uniref:uncharacterized protein n=1 Tax=Alternaria arbusti TaxID=232088 RepID=UPI00221E811E|nr:uncharacterized protein J4E86_001364 [Alternaria arbusti]KAI4962331.1 hypothetical protein J4E86_001364 [Alternaria arbusti]
MYAMGFVPLFCFEGSGLGIDKPVHGAFLRALEIKVYGLSTPKRYSSFYLSSQVVQRVRPVRAQLECRGAFAFLPWATEHFPDEARIFMDICTIDAPDARSFVGFSVEVVSQKPKIDVDLGIADFIFWNSDGWEIFDELGA